MLTFHAVRYKNFRSTGNVFNELQLDSHKSSLVSGINGGGKCVRLNTIINVIGETDESSEKFRRFLDKRQAHSNK